MLYFVGGASRSGKTTLAQEILRQHNVSYVSIDWLMMGFTNGIPDFGIHDRLFPDEIAERIWGFLRAMCESMLWTGADAVIEGEAILPSRLKGLIDDYPTEVRACFVGYADSEVDEKFLEVKDNCKQAGDWLADKPDEYVRDHTEVMIAFSRKIRADCAHYDLPYVETSGDFAVAMEEARHCLGLNRATSE